MSNSDTVRGQALSVIKYTICLASGWTLLLAAIMLVTINEEMKDVREAIQNEARTHYLKDEVFRYWAFSHGGVYVPTTDDTTPDPDLAHLPNRDIVTTEGLKLTLMNPAYLVRQLMNSYEEEHDVKGSLTSLKPLRTLNAPDDWERAALESFESGATEAKEFCEIDGKLYLRLMHPIKIEESCLNCHGQQGYKVGDIRGGVGVSIPADDYYDAANTELLEHAFSLGLLWVVGLSILVFGARRIQKRVREQQLAEDALRDSEDRFRKYFQLGLVGMAISSIDKRWVEVNDTLCRMLGYSRESITGLSWVELTHPDDLDENIELYDRVVAGEIDGYTIEKRFIHKDGHFIQTAISANCIRKDDGSVDYFIAMFDDLTETKRLQDQEARAARLEAAGIIAGQVAHDFNNLLTPLMACPELIREELPAEHPALTYLDDIVNATTKIAEINQDLLTMGRRGHFNQQLLDINQTIQQTIKESQYGSGSTSFKMEFAEQLSPIMGGNAQISRMLLNLIRNAQEAVGDSGQIKINTENCYVKETTTAYGHLPQGDYVKLTISDNGCGIPEEIVQEILAPFFTTKGTDNSCGSGLGLSVVNAVVRDHNGYLDLTSKVGQGTSFFIYFPVPKESDQKPEAAPLVSLVRSN